MIPSYVKPFLWSYDIAKIDLSKDKKRIITNVLNLGTARATDWLFKTYEKEDIIRTLSNPLPGEISDKSLNYWSLILNIKSKNNKRHVL